MDTLRWPASDRSHDKNAKSKIFQESEWPSLDQPTASLSQRHLFFLSIARSNQRGGRMVKCWSSSSFLQLSGVPSPYYLRNCGKDHKGNLMLAYARSSILNWKVNKLLVNLIKNLLLLLVLEFVIFTSPTFWWWRCCWAVLEVNNCKEDTHDRELVDHRQSFEVARANSSATSAGSSATMAQQLLHQDTCYGEYSQHSCQTGIP